MRKLKATITRGYAEKQPHLPSLFVCAGKEYTEGRIGEYFFNRILSSKGGEEIFEDNVPEEIEGDVPEEIEGDSPTPALGNKEESANIEESGTEINAGTGANVSKPSNRRGKKGQS